MTTNNIVEISDANFDQEVVSASSEKPVLVDFWAEWCGPCKRIAPILEEIAEEQSGAVKIAKVDVDENQALASKFGIRSIPTLMIFKNGEVADTMLGAHPKEDIIGALQKVAG